MPALPHPFAEWLSEVSADSIHVNESVEGLNEEANANLWGFGHSEEGSTSVTEDVVVEFVRAVATAREAQIVERLGGHAMVMYCWTDEMIGQLRTSLVSASHGRLPFGAPPDKVEDIREIARAYLALVYSDGIPLGEFKVMTQEDIDSYVEPPPSRLRARVWATALPKVEA